MKHISSKGVEYPLVFNLNVMEKYKKNMNLMKNGEI